MPKQLEEKFKYTHMILWIWLSLSRILDANPELLLKFSNFWNLLCAFALTLVLNRELVIIILYP